MPKARAAAASATEHPGRGRPPNYSAALAQTICWRISCGESLRHVCTDDAMPHAATVLRWAAEREDFREQYARACEARAHLLADEILELADAAGMEDPQAQKLKVDARKWVASKLLPRVYGDRIATQQLGANGEPVDPTISEARMWQMLFKQLPTDLVRQIADHLENEGATDAE